VDCIVSLPEKLFFNTGIPVSLWFLSKNRQGNGHRERRGEILFIDARKLGTMVTRRLRELTEADIEKLSSTYHAWRNRDGGYVDVAGFAKSASLEEVAAQEFMLAPGRYVGAADTELDAEPIDEKISRLTHELLNEFARGREFEEAAAERLGKLTAR